MIRASIILLVGAVLLAGCQDQPGKSSPSAKTSPKDKLPLTSVAKKDEPKEEAKTPSNANNPIILIDTSMGAIKAELFEDKAPITVKNMLGYIEEKFYDGTVFHRVIPDFMIQGGGFEPGMKQKETKGMIKNESDNGLENKRGTLAMARTPAPDSASCQFFVNVKDNAFLDRARARDKVGYCVFGQVLEGMDTVDKIRKVPTGERGGHEAVPLEDVMIKSIRRVQ